MISLPLPPTMATGNGGANKVVLVLPPGRCLEAFSKTSLDFGLALVNRAFADSKAQLGSWLWIPVLIYEGAVVIIVDDIFNGLYFEFRLYLWHSILFIFMDIYQPVIGETGAV